MNDVEVGEIHLDPLVHRRLHCAIWTPGTSTSVILPGVQADQSSAIGSKLGQILSDTAGAESIVWQFGLSVHEAAVASPLITGTSADNFDSFRILYKEGASRDEGKVNPGEMQHGWSRKETDKSKEARRALSDYWHRSIFSTNGSSDVEESRRAVRQPVRAG